MNVDQFDSWVFFFQLCVCVGVRAREYFSVYVYMNQIEVCNKTCVQIHRYTTRPRTCILFPSTSQSPNTSAREVTILVACTIYFPPLSYVIFYELLFFLWVTQDAMQMGLWWRALTCTKPNNIGPQCRGKVCKNGPIATSNTPFWLQAFGKVAEAANKKWPTPLPILTQP